MSDETPIENTITVRVEDVGQSPSSDIARSTHIPEVQSKVPPSAQKNPTIIYLSKDAYREIGERLKLGLEAAKKTAQGTAPVNPNTGSGGRVPPVPPNRREDQIHRREMLTSDPEHPWRSFWPGLNNDVVGRRYWRQRQRIINNSMNLITRSRIKQEKADETAENRAQRITRGIPESFRPQVKNPNNRRDQWRQHQRETQRQKSDTRRAEQETRRRQQAADRKTARTRRIAEKAQRAGERRLVGYGRSTGASIGAGLGAKYGGPIGAAVGAQVGSDLGGKAVTAAQEMLGAKNLAGIARLASVVAVPLVAAAVEYAVYNKLHKTVNTLISDGLEPFARSIGKATPVVSNFIATFEALQTRFARDAEKYGSTSPEYLRAKSLGEVQIRMNRLQELHRQDNRGGTLGQYMGRMETLNARWTTATDRIEGTLSREVYARIIPLAEKGIQFLEDATPAIEGIIKISAAVGDGLVQSISAGISQIIPPIPKELIDGLLKWLGIAVNEINQAKLEREFQRVKGAKIFAEEFQSNLKAIFFDHMSELAPGDQEAMRQFAGAVLADQNPNHRPDQAPHWGNNQNAPGGW